jgi:hypothetical protein
MRRVLLGVGATLAAAVVVLVVAFAHGWWRGGAHVPPPSQPLVTTASLSTRSISFGDPLTARLDLLVDRRRADPATVSVRPRFSPYRVAKSALRTRSAGAILLSYRYELECLSPACVPGRAQAEQHFPAALVSYRTRSGRLVTQPVEWPSYETASRVTAADRRAPTERLRTDAALSPVTYRLDPGTLQTLLTALSAALVLLAAALTALAFRRQEQPLARAEPELAPLDGALQLVRASTANGFPAERRKALGWLARELQASGRNDLAHDAVRLAWSAEAPSPEVTGAFAAQVEAALGDET